jgi:hypothetical protein
MRGFEVPIVWKASVRDASAKTDTVAPRAADAARITTPRTAQRAFIKRDLLAAHAPRSVRTNSA